MRKTKSQRSKTTSQNGYFITFEGTEGAGKSTLMKNLDRRFRAMGFHTLCTREPGGPKLSEKIRDLILKHDMDPWTELFLYEASRSEHVVSTILPALEKGYIVLCDRFTDSSLAYQAHARGLNWKKVKLLNQFATHGKRPDLTVFLDLPPKRGLSRANDRNRFEMEGVRFQEKVRKGFLKAQQENPGRWLSLNVSSLGIKETAELAEKKIKERLRRRGFKV